MQERFYLEQNYRSTKSILEAANHVINNNKGRKPKKLWTENEEGKKITYFQGATEREEALFVTEKIQDTIGRMDIIHQMILRFYIGQMLSHVQLRIR